MITQCQACGASVSAQFVRVFGGNDDAVYACPECSVWEDIKNGAGVSASATGTRETTVGPAVGAEPADASGESGEGTSPFDGPQIPASNGATSNDSNGAAFVDLLG